MSPWEFSILDGMLGALFRDLDHHLTQANHTEFSLMFQTSSLMGNIFPRLTASPLYNVTYFLIQNKLVGSSVQASSFQPAHWNQVGRFKDLPRYLRISRLLAYISVQANLALLHICLYWLKSLNLFSMTSYRIFHPFDYFNCCSQLTKVCDVNLDRWKE